MAADKCRYYAFEVYPESAPADWVQKLRDSHGSFLISPLHTPEDGKPHHHVVYMHGGPTTLSVVQRVVPDGIPANGYIEPLHSPRNYQRYLLHLDDPDKQQFDGSPLELLTAINGFPVDLSREFSKPELQQMRIDILNIINELNITEYSELIDYLLDTNLDLLDYAANHTIFFNAKLTSRRHALGFDKGFPPYWTG